VQSGESWRFRLLHCCHSSLCATQSTSNREAIVYIYSLCAEIFEVFFLLDGDYHSNTNPILLVASKFHATVGHYSFHFNSLEYSIN